jgi:dTDP-4-dehydrorhamnose reductase
MKARTILVTGKNGQLGHELRRALAPLGEVVAVGQADCDLGNPEALRVLVRRVAPDVIVNPAAYTAVDTAETDESTAFAVNAAAAGILAEEAARLGALLVHYSTDYVFDGDKQGAYVETDAPHPLSVYGRTKLAGEELVRANAPRHVILRTSWVVGSYGGNFARTMLRLARQRDSLNVVADQFGAPTPAALLADASAHVVRRYLDGDGDAFPYGLYHLSSRGETNWHAYAQYVIAAAWAAGQQLALRPEAMQAIPAAQYPTPARRPTNSVLDSSLFERTFGLRVPPWQEGLDRILQQLFDLQK